MRIVLGLILLLAAGVVYLSFDDRAWQRAPLTTDNETPADDPLPTGDDEPARDLAATEPVRRDLRDVTPPGAVRLPTLEKPSVERLPAVVPPPPPPRPPEPVLWPLPVVETAGSILSRGVTIDLAGIETLPLEARCGDEAGGQWPCGRLARAALRRLVRNRTIACDPPEPADGEARIERICRLGDQDLSAWLVERGWADAKSESPYLEAARQAQDAGRGQWSPDRPR